MFKKILDSPRPIKRTLVIVVDLVLALIATVMAYSLRFKILH